MFQMNTMHNAMHRPYVTHDCASVSLLKGWDLDPIGIDPTIVGFLYKTDQQAIYHYPQLLVHEKYHPRLISLHLQ